MKCIIILLVAYALPCCFGSCNVHLTAANGSFTSPGFPAKYKNNANCTTRITVAAGKHVNLHFTAFSLESQSSCSYDYVEIIDGSSSVKYCGNRLPPVITSETNELTIKFKTDGVGVYRGFSAAYSTVDDGCHVRLTAENGKITSPGYPAEYHSKKKCTTKITVAAGKRISLVFKEFDLQSSDRCKYHYVEIIDGSYWWRYCGYRLPPSFVSKNNELTIKFNTASSRVHGRFAAAYSTVDAIDGCNFQLTTATGMIFSPGYPANYKNNLNCTTTITAAKGKRVVLYFKALHLQRGFLLRCNYDSLEIIDGSSSEIYCGKDEMPSPTLSQTNKLVIRFRTNGFGTYSGYFATYKTVDDSFRTGCNDHLLSENGTISSFGYPNRYREKLDCTTTITVPRGKVVVLNFKSFDVGHQYGCTYEYLSIRDGDAYRKYCYERIPSLYQSKTNKLTIRFKTDPYGSNKGYFATYKTLNAPRIQDCNKTLIASSNGTLSSPGYPSHYQYNLYCTTRILIPEGKMLQVAFLQFSLGSSCDDYLSVTHGTGKVKYCSRKPRPFNATGNQLTLTFMTDMEGNNKGYFATYRTVDDSNYIRLTAESGKVTSPGYPANYQNNLYRTTKITVAAGKRINLVFTAFSLEGYSDCTYDYVEIIDGSTSKKYCGNTLPPSFTTKTNELTIKFKTDSVGVYGGFSAIYSTVDAIDGCNFQLTTATGMIFSPGYPANYKNNLVCTTTITVATGKRVSLNFKAFHLEKAESSLCRLDYLEITDGTRSRKYCGDEKMPSPYLSRTNKLVIRFKTDYSVTHSGYFATYKTVDASPPQTVNDRNCGKRFAPQARIIGGTDAKKGAWPWQIGMFSRRDKLLCGGSLISPLWMITAAVCVGKASPDQIYIRVGDWNLNTNDGTEQKIDVDAIYPHKKFNSANWHYDTALLKLKRPAMMNNYVNTVCVPGENETIPVGSTCFMTGWGNIKFPGSIHQNLQQASMQVIDSRVCQKRLDKLKLALTVTDQMLCAGELGTTKSACNGDSGGPLVCLDASTNRYVLHGAVSWGSYTCSAAEMYTVFSRVQSLKGWIDTTMREN